MDTLDTLSQVIAEHFHWVDNNDIKTTADLESDLGADSLDLVELLMEVEEVFEIEVSDEDAEKVKTVADAVSMIDRLKEGK